MDRKRAEEAVVRLERLGAIGEMSAGISHNLNNILTGILGPAELITFMTKQDDVLREADLIRTSGLRARDLVMRLHESVRSEREKVGVVELDSVVEEAIAAGLPRWKAEPESRGQQVRLDSDLKSGVVVAANGPGLHDLVLNLLFNASDALTSGETITVQTGTRDGRALLMVSDDGIGMDAEVKRRVFEPFFTTKADVGTGLGLSMVYGQVTRWGGVIDVLSRPGEGTTFEIERTIWNGNAALTDRVPTSVRPGRVLVVEDEEMVRDVVSRVLGLKHEVITVEDGPSALAAVSESDFDVLLIDLGIPGMPVDQIFRHIRNDNPLVATVLMTGWNLAENDSRAEPFDLRIQKPFESMAGLIEIVDRAIQLRDGRTV